ncbi:phytoene/squalene synthase family protein [Ilyomonas limi]|uniref:Phytoene/squalene synthase family protein n=1 Tax=Ilyomonas limi TaxID=2575867 RepID=A0A4V5UTB1_9BACT|nr:phytoene/squalene synthase family protein [Ilyomonas limi]TKK64243.1 phytoene/squalene synthase family protein [Ilyomonas limi]
MIVLFHKVSEQCSKLTTQTYSTSFASSIRLLHKDLQAPIHNIYGFVRFADEIVDTFHDYDKITLLSEFKRETYAAIERGISLNPILHSFQRAVHTYGITTNLIDAFFKSMAMDIDKTQYDTAAYSEYIYGSAEVVGLMCLHVFCNGDTEKYSYLKSYAQSLGAAFQKVNFLRDLRADYLQLNRVYFPYCDFNNFTHTDKMNIEKDIQKDFDHAYEGIIQLPLKARFGVYVAYKYYLSLFRKIKQLHPQSVMQQRIRIPDYYKAVILAKASVRNRLNMI